MPGKRREEGDRRPEEAANPEPKRIRNKK